MWAWLQWFARSSHALFSYNSHTFLIPTTCVKRCSKPIERQQYAYEFSIGGFSYSSPPRAVVQAARKRPCPPRVVIIFHTCLTHVHTFHITEDMRKAITSFTTHSLSQSSWACPDAANLFDDDASAHARFHGSHRGERACPQRFAATFILSSISHTFHILLTYFSHT